jgi:hypothetical protein
MKSSFEGVRRQMPQKQGAAMIVYAVEVEHPSPFDTSQTLVSPICAYTSKEEAEKHIQSLQTDLFGETHYFWEALEVKERYEPAEAGDASDSILPHQKPS